MAENFIQDDEFANPQMFEWAFPEVEVTVSEAEDTIPVVTNEEKEAAQAEQAAAAIKEEEDKALEMQVNDFEKMKAEYQEKIEIMHTIMNKLKYPMSIIDDELIEIMLEIIKKSVNKIIHKEIKQDPSLMQKMINELMDLVKTKDGMVTIYTSAEDYQFLNNENNQQFSLINVDEALKSGDVIIKSNSSEVRAILDERIENLLRIQYG